MKKTFLVAMYCISSLLFGAGVAQAQTSVERLVTMGGLSEAFLNAPLPKVYNVGEAHWNYAGAVGAGDAAYETLLNEGLGFYHVFHYIDATRAFYQAMLLQPNATLPRLGLAISVLKLAGDQNAALTAYKEYQNAQRLMLANGGTVEEKFWVQFFGVYLENLLGVDFSLPSKERIQDIYAGYTLKNTDVEYLVLGANMLSDLNVISLNDLKTNYTKAISLNPKHVGALHYMTHVAEALDEKKDALEYGRLAALYSPESSHIQHMYGHNLPIFGNWLEASAQFVIADDLHQTWAADNNVPLTYDWHYTHNLFLWGYAQIGAGLDMDKALQTLVMSCQTEVHHCMTTFYAVVAYGDVTKAKEMIQVLNSNNQVAQADLFQQTLYWLGLEAGDASGLQATYSSPRANFMYIVNEMLQGRDIPDTLAVQVQNALMAQLTRAGFDSWSQVLPMALLLRGTAQKVGNAKVLNVIDTVFQQINFRPQK
ncbi:MAG: hypothetical protein M9899_07000 [Bdellovibrionaceae bacterium]|nr:hypothetical protein [Pseudobdellovibrionaceae bacterium]